MVDEKKINLGRVFWPLVIALLIIVGVVVFFTQTGFRNDAVPTAPSTPSTEWTTAPDAGVEVELPETPLRRVEPEEAQDEDEIGTSEE